MTATATPHAEGTLWGSMPGWGIVTDLTPRELVDARRLKGLRKLIGAALALVVVLCAAGYVSASLKGSSASDALSAAQSRTGQLMDEQRQYAKVTQIQAATDSVNTQIESLTATDVDVALLIGRIRGALPGSMSVTSISVTMSGASGDTETAPSLDSSGHATVGTVTLAGTSQHLIDLADFVTALSSLRGVVNVVPASNTTGTAGTAQWNVTLQVTDTLYTHGAGTPTGGN